jgi:quinol monooxygenase YgiN
MKRSDMLLNIASELVHEHTNFMAWDKAQELAKIVLSRIEKDGMLPPPYDVMKDRKNDFNQIYMMNRWEDEEK